MKPRDFPFKEVWCVDFEFRAPDGETPDVRCLVAKEIKSGRTVRLWADECKALSDAPFNVGDDSLLVAYFSSAEWGCFLSLGWELPTHVLDLYVEFRGLRNGTPPIRGYGLVGALGHFGLDSIAVEAKDAMRDLAMRMDEHYTDEEKAALIAYCESDVLAVEALLGKILNGIDLPQALFRGRYMKAIAKVERNGIPIDMGTLEQLKQHWSGVRQALIAEVDHQYQVYEGQTFKVARFERLLASYQIYWPRTDRGALRLDDETFEEMAKTYPILEPLRQLRATLSRLKLNKLAVGSDGRNRCLLSPFSSITSRNQPSNSKFIYGLPSWARHLIKPREGMGLAYIDWSQQEIGIGAALSKDENMMEAYRSGDFYTTFAKQAGAVPMDATKSSHKVERDLFKQCALAVQYGMGEKSLALRINRTTLEARRLLELHRNTYPLFWKWSDAALTRAMTLGELHTTFGWKLHTPRDPNDRSLRNFPIQANGAEMLRLALCFMTEAGIKVCAPVHDAILIEAPLESLDDAILQAQMFMRLASEIILGGFSLGTDVDVIRFPGRFTPEKGSALWATVLSCLDTIAADPKEAA